MDEWSASSPTSFTPRKIVIGIHWKGGWAGNRTCIYTVKKLITLPCLSSQHSIAIQTHTTFKLVFFKKHFKATYTTNITQHICHWSVSKEIIHEKERTRREKHDSLKHWYPSKCHKTKHHTVKSLFNGDSYSKGATCWRERNTAKKKN
jgi:hypothetical protein